MKPLERHPALIELSREYHGSLPLCVRPLCTPDQSYQTELESHFAEFESYFLEEETISASHWDKTDPALRQRLKGDHAKLRVMMAYPEYMNRSQNKEFVITLRDHVRFEECEFFPAIEPFLLLSESVQQEKESIAV